MAEVIKKEMQVVVLAAGYGKRMRNETLPKVLVPYQGQPMILHLLNSIKHAGVDDKIAIVVGQKADLVKEALGPDYIYILQPEQKGTGHAVLCAKDVLENSAANIMVLYGDHPLLTPSTIKNIATEHLRSGAVLTMSTVKLSDLHDWRAVFYDFGRVVRDESGRIKAIIEKKDATPDELLITEVNPSFFVFKAQWLWANLPKLTNQNKQQEFYLTDMAQLAFKQNLPVHSVVVEAEEALGVNTPDHLILINRKNT